MTMVRNKAWKLVHYLRTDTDQGELYSLTDDPGEHNNLWENKEFLNKKRELIDRILEWSLESSLQTQGWSDRIK